MQYSLLANTVVVIHLAFVAYVVFGGLLSILWPRQAWMHIPSLLWGAATALFGWICPLTYLENELRRLGKNYGYSGGFFEEYLLPLLYPDLLFIDGFPRSGFIVMGISILLINVILYAEIHRRIKAD